MAIKSGDKIKVDYEGSLDNGQVFDSSKHGDHSHPLEFEVGARQVISGFDKAVIGMKKGEEKEFSIPAKEAYGERNKDLEKEIPRSSLPKGQEPQVGMGLMLNSPDGRQIPAMISKVDEQNITIDLNHPLAGKKLNFKIKVLEIN
ncbi:MAG: peptidylprolyl isomerase [Nanoarchaeota archaeon]|nr:peptidylprolyl isomerase [Nanoarchaeota archaeon]